MFGTMSRDDAQGALEDVVMLKARAAGAAEASRVRNNNELVAQVRRLDALLEQGINKVAEQKATIESLRKELSDVKQRASAAQSELDALKERNADHVAVANATALTLNSAINELADKAQEPQIVQEKFLQIRSRNYDEQVAKMIDKGFLKTDPRSTQGMKNKPWYHTDVSASGTSRGSGK